MAQTLGTQSIEIIKKFPIESKNGFTFAIELLAKAYSKGYKITEVPSKSPIRKFGESKLGLASSYVWPNDPRRLFISLSRYKFVSKMLEGKNNVLEIG